MKAFSVKTVFGIALLALAGVVQAQAADLPQPPPPPPPQAPAAYIPAPPVYDWGGVYFGINGGWGWGNGKWTANLANGTSLSANANDNGGIVGATLGGNYQIGGLVLGIEGDWDYSGINTGTSSTICTFSGTCQTGNNWLATLRGRFGWAADRVLFYGTAGGAFVNVQTAFSGTTTTHSQAGWTAGVGAEWAFANNWTARVEYLFVDVGAATVSCSVAACLAFNKGAPIPVSVSLSENLLRLGVDYKFNF